MIAEQSLTTTRPPRLLWVLGLLLLLALVRSLVTFPVEHIDAAHKYQAAADIVRDGAFEPLLRNHHTMRWSETLPQVLVGALTGLRFEGLYLLPLLVFGAYSALLWRGLQPVLSLGQQGLLLALLFIEPINVQHSGQLLNPPFGVLYTVLALTLLATPGPVSWPRIVLAALCFFAAYGAHSTYLSFAAAGVAWLLFEHKTAVKAAALAALVALAMVLETVAFNLLAGDSLQGGRLQALAGGGHIAMVYDRYEPVTVLELFTRWLRLSWFNLAVTAGFVLTTLWLVVNRDARRKAPPFLRLCVLAGGAYATAITFAVVSLDPLRPMQPLRVIYLEPFMPFAIAVSVYGAAQIEALLRPAARLVLEGSIVAVMVAIMFYVGLQKLPLRDLVNYRLNAFAWRADTEFNALAEQVNRGELILYGMNRAALDMVLGYGVRQPLVRSEKGAPRVVSAPVIRRDARCINSFRRFPLERNIHACDRNQRRLAIRAGARWQKAPPKGGDETL